MMVLSSPSLCLVMLAIVPLVLMVLALWGPRVRVSGKELQDSVGHVAAQLAESLTAVREIQAFGCEQQQMQFFLQRNRANVAAAWRYMRRRGVLSSCIITLLFSSIAGLLWFGGQQVMRGDLSPGQLSAFVFYGLLVAGSAGALSETYGDVQRAAGALSRLQALKNAPATIAAPAQPKEVPAASKILRFEGVSFHHATRPDVNVLDRVDLELDTAQTIAFVGPSGAGKSTLFDMVLRFYDPNGGRVSLDGSDIREFVPSEYRKLFSWVPQDPTLFSMSIAENIGFGATLPRAAIESAARAACIHDFIAALPDGYDTALGERGVNLSGGQAQRLALARALAHDPHVLLLDEATAHLDTENEALVHKALREVRSGRGIWLIAHRISTAQQADCIVVLEAGRVAAIGTHQELVKDCALYQRLAKGQG